MGRTTPTEVEQLVCWNHEAIPLRHDTVDCFIEFDLFKTNPAVSLHRGYDGTPEILERRDGFPFFNAYSEEKEWPDSARSWSPQECTSFT